MKREPVRLGDQSLQKCFMVVLFKIRSANVFLVFIFTANWVLLMVLHLYSLDLSSF